MKLKLVGILTLCLLIMVSIFQSCTISLSGATLDKVRAESRLVLSEEEPDIEFRGTLVDYRITAEAPRTGESTAINRLTITLAISYFNNRTNTEIWQKNFSFFYDFSSAIDFSSVQETANKAISKQIMEDIFNAAFSNW